MSRGSTDQWTGARKYHICGDGSLCRGALVAISIPIFTSQLEKNRDAVTLSNIRAAYAQAQTAYLTESSDGTNVVYTPTTTDKETTVVVKGVVSKGTQEGLNNLDQLPFGGLVNGGAGASDWKDKTSLGGKAKSWDITFTYNANGAIDKIEAATAK